MPGPPPPIRPEITSRDRVRIGDTVQVDFLDVGMSHQERYRGPAVVTEVHPHLWVRPVGWSTARLVTRDAIITPPGTDTDHGQQQAAITSQELEIVEQLMAAQANLQQALGFYRLDDTRDPVIERRMAISLARQHELLSSLGVQMAPSYGDCVHCKGRGFLLIPGQDHKVHECIMCGSTGRETPTSSPAGSSSVSLDPFAGECEACFGKGRLEDGDTCPVCARP